MHRSYLDYKHYSGDYRKLAEDITRHKDAEYRQLGERLLKVQDLFDIQRKYIIKQKQAVTNINIGILSQNPQNPQSADEVGELRKIWNVSDEKRFTAMLMGLCAHVLLVGKPGRGKTVLCLLLAALIKASFARIQCTVDTDPSDIRGSAIPLSDGSIQYMTGPIENNIVLADEINRATGKRKARFSKRWPKGNLPAISMRILMAHRRSEP